MKDALRTIGIRANMTKKQKIPSKINKLLF